MSQPEVEVVKVVESHGREKSTIVGRGKNPVLLRVYYKGAIPDHCLRARQTHLTEFYKFARQSKKDEEKIHYTIETDPITGRETLRID